MRAFDDWVRARSRPAAARLRRRSTRPFDWMFVADYAWRYLGRNPFGRTAPRHQGALPRPPPGRRSAAGPTRPATTCWRATRSSSPHTHRALDDAREQAEICRLIRDGAAPTLASASAPAERAVAAVSRARSAAPGALQEPTCSWSWNGPPPSWTLNCQTRIVLRAGVVVVGGEDRRGRTDVVHEPGREQRRGAGARRKVHRRRSSPASGTTRSTRSRWYLR